MVQTFEQLVEEHQPLVLSLAQKIHKRLPAFISFDDVLSYGQLGLVQAARTYQPTEGAMFATYAYYRVQGAIYDGVARLNWTSRSAYRKLRREQIASDVLEDQAQQNPSNSASETATWLFETSSKLAVVYLSTPVGEESSLEETVEDTDARSPSEAAETHELSELLKQKIGELGEQEQTLVKLVYFQNKTLAEAGKTLGKSKSWASRTHATVLGKLAKQLA